MPSRAKDELVNRFLQELALTLDVDTTIKELHITEGEARAILRSLVTPEKPAPEKAVNVTRGTKGALEIYVDGASRGNPGKAGAGAVIKDPNGMAIRKLKKYLGIMTNNMAEYNAIIMALEAARSMAISHVKVFADSELMVKQINGVYRVKSEDLRPLYEKVRRLIEGFDSFTVEHVYREKNIIADSLANEAIDAHKV